MHAPIYFVAFNGSFSSEGERAVLFQIAYLMMRGGQRSRKFRSKEHSCEGMVTTTFEREALGQVTGIVFEAVVEGQSGVRKGTYIIRDRDLEEILDLDEARYSYVEKDLGDTVRNVPNPLAGLRHNNN